MIGPDKTFKEEGNHQGILYTLITYIENSVVLGAGLSVDALPVGKNPIMLVDFVRGPWGQNGDRRPMVADVKSPGD